MLNQSRGNAFVLPSSGRGGGLYLDLYSEDIALANFDGLALWLDGKAVTATGTTLEMRDRVSGRPAYGYDGVTLTAGGSGRGDMAFAFTPASSARIHVPDFTLPNEYFIALVLTPPDGSANTTKVLAHTPGTEANYMRAWLEQPGGAGAAMAGRIRNDGDGGIAAGGDNLVPTATRSIVWFGQRNEDGRVYIGAGLTEKARSSGAEETRVPAPGLFLGGYSSNLSFGGVIEAAVVVTGPMSTSLGAAATARRTYLLNLLAARYGVAL